jgi:hypothetical protein
MGASIRGGLVFVALLALFATDAAAQMNNRPFSFGGGSSLGISNAGKQAILQEKLTGSTPDNIRKSTSGLITITRGPGNNAIARGADGATIPGFKGTAARSSAGSAYLTSISGAVPGVTVEHCLSPVVTRATRSPAGPAWYRGIAGIVAVTQWMPGPVRLAASL